VRTLKRNIYVAEIVCTLSLLFFVCIHFSSENKLYEIGTNIENFFHFHTDINVLTMQSFLTSISSGIFASTLVAWVFYKQEFERNKEITFLKILKCNSEITKLYANIPYIEYLGDTEFDQLARSYYYEYYNNLCYKEALKAGEEYIKKLPKSTKRVLKIEYNQKAEKTISHKAEKQLKDFLTNHKNNIEDFSNKKDFVIQDILDGIIKTLDYKIEKVSIAYNQILQYDMTELQKLVDDVCMANKINHRKKRFILKRMEDYELIFPGFNISLLDILKKQMECLKEKIPLYEKVILIYELYQDNIVSMENITKRLLTLHERAQTHIKTRFEMDNFNQLKKYNKKEKLQTFMRLQHVFIDNTKFKVIDKEMNIVYNKFNYYVENLGGLLLFEITARFEFEKKELFVIKNDRFEGNSHVFSKYFKGEDVRSDIYRP
jgi:hypothetical protein